MKFEGKRILLRATLTALIVLLGAACSKPPAPFPIEVLASELKLTNGHLVHIGQTNFFTGLMIEKYDSVVLKSRSTVSNGVIAGISEGWHTNGQLQVREFFRAGLAEGIRTKWHSNGTKASEANISGGKLNGPFRRWHSSGSLAEEVEMKNDKPDGMARAWYPSGFLKAEMRMAGGRILDEKRWTDGEAKMASVASATTRRP